MHEDRNSQLLGGCEHFAGRHDMELETLESQLADFASY
jgi:hypothetical protein